MRDLVGNPEDRFSRNEAHLQVMQVGTVGNMKILIKGYSETGHSSLTILNPNYLRDMDGVDEIIYNIVYKQ